MGCLIFFVHTNYVWKDTPPCLISIFPPCGRLPIIVTDVGIRQVFWKLDLARPCFSMCSRLHQRMTETARTSRALKTQMGRWGSGLLSLPIHPFYSLATWILSLIPPWWNCNCQNLDTNYCNMIFVCYIIIWWHSNDIQTAIKTDIQTTSSDTPESLRPYSCVFWWCEERQNCQPRKVSFWYMPKAFANSKIQSKNKSCKNNDARDMRSPTKPK